MANTINIIIFGGGALALAYGFLLITLVLRQPKGTGKMVEIASAIEEGAKAYLKAQAFVIAMVATVFFIILALSLGSGVAVGFLVGAVASIVAGNVGMRTAVKANVRTTQKAKSGLRPAMDLAFNSGAVTGLLVVGLALLSVSIFYAITKDLGALVGLGLGSSLISIFSRLGGGIYTKGADVGADLVGKMEIGIPEDDPRNPGVIADNVGDNVGDCAGTAGGLFETYVVTAIATMLLGHLVFPHFHNAIIYPLTLGGVAIVASILGVLSIQLIKGSNKNKVKIMPTLYRGFITSILASAIAFYPITKYVMTGNELYSTTQLYLATLIGLAITACIVAVTVYYTSQKFSPVKRISEASATGHGTNIIAGLAVAMRSTFAPMLILILGILGAFSLAGIYGIAIAATGMVSLVGIVVAIDSFGPITDNAGGIAEMSDLPKKVRTVTDALDAVGNTTKAITKGYSIESAVLASLALFAVYTQELSSRGANLVFSLSDPKVVIGLFIGGSIPYLFGAMCMEAVGKSAGAIVTEVRKQFKEIKGLLEGKAKPKYGRCVKIATNAALKEMVIPALITITTPIAIGLALGPLALGGALIGVAVSGFLMGISMTTGGAAWDNAKKYIETGAYGGKGSLAHSAAITGDMVGDPYKDTAGPAISPMIKVINIIALLIVGLLV